MARVNTEAAFRRFWDAGFRDLVPVIPPGAPLSAATKIKPEARGKAPGRMNQQGLWSSFDWRAHVADSVDLVRWGQMGASVGLKCGWIAAADMDVSEAFYADIVDGVRRDALGDTPVRTGRAPKRLAVYRVVKPLTRRRLWFTTPEGGKHLIELLGEGQQFVAAGLHPGTGKPYEWDRMPKADELIEITPEQVEAFFTTVKDALEAFGCECSFEGTGHAATDRTGIQQDALKGDIDLITQAVAATPNNNDLFPGRTDYVRMACAIKAACADDSSRGLDIFLEWALRWEGNDRFAGNDWDDAVSDWERCKPPFEVGAEYVLRTARAAGWKGEAEHVFPAEEAPVDGDKPASDDPRPVKYSDSALADRFVADFGETVRYVDAWGRWLMWDGQRWRMDDTRKAWDLSRKVCNAASQEAERTIENAKDAQRVATKVASAQVVSNVLRLSMPARAIARTTDDWDADPWLLNSPGGIVDLRTGECLPHDPAKGCTKITAVAPGGDCPTWCSFLYDASGHDTELVDYLQRVVGYSLTGVTRDHALFFAHGPGGNGKGVFTNTLTAILGDYACVAGMETFVASNGDRHPTELARLRGARLVTAQETEEGRRWAESRIKALTGGDPITARFMRQDDFTFMPQFKLLIVGNHKPQMRNVDDAMRRRLQLIPFTFRPPKPDPDLPERLKAEWGGIMAWAVEGCLAWQRVGLKPPRVVLDATEEYFEAEDAFGRWLLERTSRDPNAFSLTRDLFADWRQWCTTTGEWAGTEKRFSEMLDTRGFVKARSRTGRMGFRGIEPLDDLHLAGASAERFFTAEAAKDAA